MVDDPEVATGSALRRAAVPREPADALSPQSFSAERQTANLIHKVEQIVYIVVAVLLVMALALALSGATAIIWTGMPSSPRPNPSTASSTGCCSC